MDPYQNLFQPAGIQIPENIGSYDPYSQYNPNAYFGGRMPMGIGSLLTSMFGGKMWPLVGGSQSGPYDAAWNREHSMQMMGLARSTVSSFYPFQNLGGMNQNSIMTQIVSSLMSDPDGIAAKIMSPVLGGNPIAAQMSSFATLQGIGGSGLGTGQGVSTGELTRALSDFNDSFLVKDAKPINKEKGQALADQIIGPKGLDQDALTTLGITGNEAAGMLDENHQIVGTSKGYDKLERVGSAIDTITSRLGTGTALSADEAMKGMKDTLGDSYDAVNTQVQKAFAGSKHEYLSGVGQALGDNAKGLSDDNVRKLIDAFKNGTMSNDEKTKFGDAMSDALKKNAPILAKAYADQTTVKSISDAHKATGEIGQMMLMQNIFRGMNFKNNLGLSSNTLLTARDEFIKDRLFTPTQEVPDLNALSRLAGGAGGAVLPSLITAAKGLFGNDMPDKELMTHISNYIGNSAFSINSRADSERLETSMREMKATAREDNINLNTLLSFHAQAQSYAAQDPRLKAMGGIELADMVTKTAQEVAAVATDNSADNNWMIRYQGGTTGQAAKSLQNKLEATSNPTIIGAAAVRTYISEHFTDEAKRKDLLDKYDKWAAGGTDHMRDQFGLTDWMNENFKNTDTSAARAWQYAYDNPMAAAQAYEESKKENKDLANQLPVGMQLDTLKSRIIARLQNNKEGIDDRTAIDLGKKAGEKMTPVEVFDAYLHKNIRHKMLSNPYFAFTQGEGPNSLIAQMKDADDKGIYLPEILEGDPILKANYEKNQAVIKASALIDKQFDQRMGSMRPNTITRLVQAFASGDFSKEGAVDPFLKAMGISQEAADAMGLTSMVSKLSKIGGAGTAGDVASTLGMSPDDTKTVEALSKASDQYGIKGGDLAKIAKMNSLEELKNSKLLQDSKLPKDDAEFRTLKDLATKGTNVAGLYTPVLDEHGNQVMEGDKAKTAFFDKEFSKENLQEFGRKNLTGQFLREAYEARGVKADFNQYIQNKLVNDPHSLSKGDPTTQAMGKAIDALSPEIYDSHGDKTGRKDYLAGLETLSKAEQDTATVLGGGKFGLTKEQTAVIKAFDPKQLPKDLQDLLKPDAKGDFTFTSEDDAKSAAASVSKLMKDTPGVESMINKGETVSAEYGKDTTAEVGDDLPNQVGRILAKLDGFKEIAKAIIDLTGVINTK